MVNYRPVTEEDFPALINLFLEFAEFEKRKEFMINSLERMKKEKAYINGFIAKEGNTLVGYVTYYLSYHTWTGKAIHMDDLYVKEIFRGQGIGGKLLEKVKEAGITKGCHTMRWKVSKWNGKAKSFYHKIGATISNREEDCILDLT